MLVICNNEFLVEQVARSHNASFNVVTNQSSTFSKMQIVYFTDILSELSIFRCLDITAVVFSLFVIQSDVRKDILRDKYRATINDVSRSLAASRQALGYRRILK